MRQVHDSPRLGVLGARLRELVLLWAALAVQPVPTAAGHAQTQAPLPTRALPDPDLPDAGLWGLPGPVIHDRLIQGRLVRIKKGRGGRSLGFKLYFADGTKAYFKPDQAFSGTNWFAEVAAYHLDRLLDLGRVPPVVAHRMPWAPLRKVAGRDRRVDEIHVADDGHVTGALVYWLPEALGRADTPPGWENWLRVTPFVRWSVTPFQRPAAYAAALLDRKGRVKRGESAASYFDDVPEVADPALPPALSDMGVLDFLTLNIDRWGGHNANVLAYGNGEPKQLIFLDNAAGFSPGPARRGLLDDRLAVQQCFRRRTVERLRDLSIDALRAKLSAEPYATLSDDQLADLEVRRKALLAHVDGLIAEHGEAAVLKWP